MSEQSSYDHTVRVAQQLRGPLESPEYDRALLELIAWTYSRLTSDVADDLGIKLGAVYPS